MTPETFYEKFEQFAEAPNTVAKMRELVLHLAITGKLADPDPTESLSNSIQEIVPPKPPLRVPETWQWTEFGKIAEISGGFAFKSADYTSDGVFVLRVTNIEASGVINKHKPVFLPPEKVTKDVERFYLNEGDILLVMVGGSLGKIGLVTSDILPALLNQNLWRITPVNTTVDYQFLRLITDFIVSFQRQITHSTHGHLSRADFRKKPVAIPPLAEQKRIVAKVDELMALCDQLELQQQERETRHSALCRASLAHFANSPTPHNLNPIFHQSYHIPPADLRKTILTLAVQGKLVPQDPNEEPAEKSLAEIENLLTYTARQRRNAKAHDDTGQEDPFQLPVGWAWARFPDLGEFGRGKSKHRPRNDPSLYAGGTHRLVQTGDVARSNGTIQTYTGVYNNVGLAQSKMWPAGTLCITIAANIADSGILGFDACFPDSVVGFIPAEPIPSVSYFEYFMRTAKENLERFAPSTAQKNINLGILEQVKIPIPPLAEQRRIVAKVDQLMVSVDELETQLAASRATAKNLLEALVAELTIL
jgi:type I restriction enzyme S subunit